MDLPRYQSSYLLAQFREFYREMDRLRRRVVIARKEVPVPVGAGIEEAGESFALAATAVGTGSHVNGGTAAAASASEPLPPPPRVTNGYSSHSSGVWQQLLTLLERQAFEAGQSGGAFAYEIYREAQYVMAALADEVFLNLNWEGRESWPLLEGRLFQTHYAGEAIFQRLDRLLQRHDPFYLDLAAVYFMALSLDFKGKYRDNDSQGRLQVYRHQLFAMIYRREPELYSSTAPLFPQSLLHTLDEGSGRRLPDRKIWLLLVAGVIAAWLAMSGFAWTSVNNPVSCLICQVTNPKCVCDAGGQ